MSEEHAQRLTPLVIDTGGGPIEFLAAHSASARLETDFVTVETIQELIAAVRAGSSPVNYKPAGPPRLLGRVLELLVRAVVFYCIARYGLPPGYKLETTYNAFPPSVTLRILPPSAGDAARPPTPGD
jgi:hypothetical protein